MALGRHKYVFDGLALGVGDGREPRARWDWQSEACRCSRYQPLADGHILVGRFLDQDIENASYPARPGVLVVENLWAFA